VGPLHERHRNFAAIMIIVHGREKVGPNRLKVYGETVCAPVITT